MLSYYKDTIFFQVAVKVLERVFILMELVVELAMGDEGGQDFSMGG